MKVAGKTIAVTGGANGIGRELVLGLLARGARVAALDLSADGLEETKKLAGSKADRVSTHVVNIADLDAVEKLPAAILEAHGQVDGLINCAGIIQPFVRFSELERKDIERVMDVNFWGVINTTKTFLPHLLERPTAHVVNVSSMGGFLPVPGQTVYGASKAAVRLLTEGLNAELTETPVNVTVVFPGAIATNITTNSGIAMPGGKDVEEAKAESKHKTLPAPEAARIIIEAMERDAYRVTVGKDATMMDRMARWMPVRSAKLIYKQMKDLLG
ncbi:MAG: SDR family oxidoreductase [Actinomycetales bacterium]|nr:SDR family oxidoreductase [Actinomycetales bacterium]